MIPLIHCRDEVAVEIGERYPEGRFIIAHLRINHDPEERFIALKPYPHLYLDISASAMARAGNIRAAVRTLGPERVLYGSDISAMDPVISVMCVRRSGISEEEQRMVFAESFKRLWAWTEEP